MTNNVNFQNAALYFIEKWLLKCIADTNFATNILDK